MVEQKWCPCMDHPLGAEKREIIDAALLGTANGVLNLMGQLEMCPEARVRFMDRLARAVLMEDALIVDVAERMRAGTYAAMTAGVGT